VVVVVDAGPVGAAGFAAGAGAAAADAAGAGF